MSEVVNCGVNWTSQGTVHGGSTSSTSRNLFVQISSQHNPRLAGHWKDHFRRGDADGVFKLFGLKANCYASSNAETVVLVSKGPLELQPMRYHGLGMKLAGVYHAAELSLTNSWAPQRDDEPNFRQLTLRLFEDTFKDVNVILAPCYLAGEEFF